MKTVAFPSSILVVWLYLITTPLYILAEPPQNMWRIGINNRKPVFFTYSTRLFNREEEIEKCLQSAAQQASKYKYLKVGFVSFQKRSAAGTGYVSDFDIYYDEKLYEKLINELEIVEQYIDSKGTAITAVLSSITPVAVDFYPIDDGIEPSWISSPPHFKGYYTAVGVSQRKRLFSGSIIAADNDALLEMVKQKKLRLQSEKYESSTGLSGTSHYESYLETTQAELRGFFVLARWRSTDGNYYYSLAICPEDP